MHRLPGFIALLLLFTLTSCGGIKVPFMGSDDDEADTVVTESSGIPKESIEMDRFGPANTDTTGISNDSNIPSSSAVVANPAPAANTSIPAPSTTAAARREPPPDPLPAANNAILRQPAAILRLILQHLRLIPLRTRSPALQPRKFQNRKQPHSLRQGLKSSAMHSKKSARKSSKISYSATVLVSSKIVFMGLWVMSSHNPRNYLVRKWI